MRVHERVYNLIVIGGGPSGMMMAGRVAELGGSVLLLEKNKILGKKLMLTGGRRCNITNAEFNVRKFLENFSDSKEFLYSPFSKFSSEDTFTFFEDRGLPLVIEARKRAFPKTQKATDVARVMEKYVKRNGIEVKTGVRVASLEKENDKIVSVKTSNGDEYFADNFAIATGGLAAPETGSTGDGFTMLQKLNHAISQPNPNIVPLTTDEKWVHALSGTTCSFMTIRFIQNGKAKIKKTGKILFTHFGISGPLILNSAHEVKKLLAQGKVEASIDLFPDTEENDLDNKILRLFDKNKNKLTKNVLSEVLPSGLADTILALPDIDIAEREVNSITKEERKSLVKKIKGLTFEITGTLGFDKAVVADGGVELAEVNFKNMTSMLYPNLYLLGDILNVNRPSGGFSLQLCWTTGWVAGSDVGNKLSKNKRWQ
ncbi:MAG TPA: NAD(P)/FAD-dependent oxidoreductase [Candidatus Kaiserbacteria bacterium]|nr:NAD(P)/FAD-dependent oxidoreductase [Candidatus Kaiserbacteria bacterium]